jgi:hypothetical protein
LAELRCEVDAANLHLERIVVRPGPTDDDKKDRAELVLAKGQLVGEATLPDLDKLRCVSGVREVHSELDGKRRLRTHRVARGVFCAGSGRRPRRRAAQGQTILGEQDSSRV